MKSHRLIIFIGVFCCLTTLFYQNFTKNIFKVGDPYDPKQWRPRVFEWFQNDMEGAVRAMLIKTRQDGLYSSGGMFMYPNPTNAYDRAFALHGKIYSRMYYRSPLTPDDFIHKANKVVALLFAVMLSAFTLYVYRQFGIGAAVALVVLTNLSDWLVFIGRNVYQVYFLRLLPFVLSMMLMPLVERKGRFGFYHYLAVIALAVLTLSLCCNEFITCIVFSVGTGPVFYGILKGHPWKQTAFRCFATCTTAAVMVAIGMLAITFQNYLYYKDWSKSIIVFHAIANRMFANDPAFASYDWTAPANVSIFTIFNQYLTHPLLSIPYQQGGPYKVALSVFAALFAYLPLAILAFADGRMFPRFNQNRRLMVALAGATLWGMLSSLSWALMKGHMWHHHHMAAMIFYIPYMLMLYIFLGKSLELAVRQIMDFVRRRSWPHLAEKP